MALSNSRPALSILTILLTLAYLLVPVGQGRALAQVDGQPLRVVDDSRFAGREIFDVTGWLQARGSGLLSNTEPLAEWGEQVNLGRMIAHEAARNGMDARVLLTLVELWGGGVSSPLTTDLTPTLPPAFRGATQYAGIEAVAAAAGAAYYNENGARAAGMSRGTYAVAVALGGGAPAPVAQVAVFAGVYQRLFGINPAMVASRGALAAGPEPTWRLPWINGERWWLNGGPHHNYGWGSVSKRPWSHLDFQPRGGGGCSTSDTNPSSIGAVAAGDVVYSDGNQVIVDHGGGWRSSYFHVRSNSRIANLKFVEAGERLGSPSCQGGRAYGVHVHFGLQMDGNFMEAAGRRLSGWEVVSTSHYSGFLRKGSFTKNFGQELDSYDDLAIAVGETRTSTLGIGQSLTYAFTVANAQSLRLTLEGSGGLDAFLELSDSSGRLITSDDDSLGGTNSKIDRELGAGSYRLLVRSYRNQSGGNYTLKVTTLAGSTTGDIRFGESRGDSVAPANQVDNFYFSAVAGRAVNITMTKTEASLDPYMELYDQNNNLVIADDDSGVDNNARIQYVLPRTGRYRIAARSYRSSSSGAYNLRLEEVSGNNLAQGRPAYGSSTEAWWLGASKAFDGDMNSRWSSSHRDPQSIYVDLGANKTIKQVILYWEAAYARSYGIYVKRDGATAWQNVAWTNSGRGGRETIVLSDSVEARYIMMYGATRGTRWGYSLYEMRVFSVIAPLVPLVGDPMPEGDKLIDDILPAPAPLPPVDDQKVAANSEESGSEGEFAQELVPLAGEEPAEVPDVATDGYLAPVASIGPLTKSLFQSSADVLYIPGNGADQDAIGDPEVSFYWTSDRDGVVNMMGSADLLPEGAPLASLAIPASQLSVGVHTLTLHVVDNEGVESAPATVQIEVTDKTRVYLPIVTR